MALKEKKKENLKEQLKSSGLIAQDDTLVDAAYANYIQMGIGGVLFQRPQPGFACFTKEKFIWTGAGADDVVIPYDQIRELSTCLVMVFPMGIKIAYEPTPGGKLVKKKFSIMSRKKWLELLSNSSHVACS